MKNQLLVAVLFAVFLVGVRTEDDDWNENDKQCAKGFNLELANLEVYTNASNLPDNNTALTNFIGCSWTKSGILNTNGEIVWDKVHEDYEKKIKEEFEKNDKLDELAIQTRIANIAIEGCRAKNLKGNNSGETAIKLHSCLTEGILEAVAEESANILNTD